MGQPPRPERGPISSIPVVPNLLHDFVAGPLVSCQQPQEAEKAYAKIRGIVIPADIYDEVTNQLKTFRSGQPAAGK